MTSAARTVAVSATTAEGVVVELSVTAPAGMSARSLSRQVRWAADRSVDAFRTGESIEGERSGRWLSACVVQAGEPDD